MGDITVFEKAVWSEETTLEFMSEGSDAGRVSTDDSVSNGRVAAVRLKDFLEEPTDFLKLDVEGAETDVLRDCASSLGKVKRIFVEYHSFRDKPQTLHEVVTILSRAGFRLQLHNEYAAATPFLGCPDYFGMDLQVNIFGYR